MQIIFDDNPKTVVEQIYGMIKNAAKTNVIGPENVEAIAELTTELANRLKVEESCG